MARKIQQSGAVSLFSVIFATMLLSVLVAGFMRLMIRDQQQATNNDLSQSAYDAALAGVEDAKRVIRSAQAGNSRAYNALNDPDSEECTVIQRAGIAGVEGDSEVQVKSSDANGEKFNQAYTCVNIAMDTPDYLYEAHEDKTWLVPLTATGEYNKIAIEWYTREDSNGAVVGNPGGSTESLPPRASWGVTSTIPGVTSSVSAPPIIRAQVINPGEQIDLSALDLTGQTAFVRPVSVSSSATKPVEVPVNLASAPRVVGDGASGANSLYPVTCSAKFLYNDEYACRTVLVLDGSISEAASSNAFLRLSSIYSGAHVRVTLLNDTNAVSFHGVQPSVDSTGRANDLFRRVEARLQLGDDFPYPEGVVDINGNICKDFSVTDTQVITNTACDPSKP